MALKFVNVKSGEERLCHTEPMIAAHLNSSDRNPNANQGQDMGWRIAPETVIELERIKGSPQELQTIAATFGMLIENVSESDILYYISQRKDKRNTGEQSTKEDFNRKYEDDIRKLRDEQARRDEEVAKERGDKPTSTSNNDKIEGKEASKEKSPSKNKSKANTKKES